MDVMLDKNDKTQDNLIQDLGKYLTDLKAKDVLALDLRGLCSWTDWFVLATYNSQGHLKGLVEELDVWAVAHDIPSGRPKKKQVNEWMLIDWDDVVVHLMSEKARLYYELEKIWFNAQVKSFNV